MSEPLVGYDVVDGVATLMFNRPERRNAWTRAMEEEYFDRLFDASGDPEVRVIVITGNPAGGAFCPGVDTDDLGESATGGKAMSRRRWPHTLLTRIPKPTIVAVNGACAGMALVQTMFADVRFAREGANFSTAFVRRGLPAENGVAWMMARLVGVSASADLLLSGRKFDAAEAKALGFVKDVVAAEELMPTVVSYARDLATNCSPGAMAQIKRQIYDGLESTMEQARLLGIHLLYEERLHDDFAEGVTSYVEKRPPRFAGVSEDLRAVTDKDPE